MNIFPSYRRVARDLVRTYTLTTIACKSQLNLCFRLADKSDTFTDQTLQLSSNNCVIGSKKNCRPIAKEYLTYSENKNNFIVSAL